METLVSTWSRSTQIIPENYIFPIGERPGSVEVPVCQNIPVIDLAADKSQTIEEIVSASKEFGLFEVKNHGVSGDLINDTKNVVKDFFDMPDEDKAKVCSNDPSKTSRLWRDNLRHPCRPLDECIPLWPEKPTNYRNIVEKYSLELRKLSLRLLELIGEGLGLEAGYFGEKLTGNQIFSANLYSPCPDPSLTLGARKHADPNLITVLLQETVAGLQVLKDGQWLGVEPLPHAFVVNIGQQLQIISNGKLKSGEHRVVTNSKQARTIIVSLILPCSDTIVEPAKEMIDNGVPLYRPVKFKDFLKFFEEKNGDPQELWDAYTIKP